MILVSEIKNTPPAKYETVLQSTAYDTLDKLNIGYDRVDTDEAITMEDCKAIDIALDVHTVKTLFLSNRQETSFYLFITRGDKPFRTKDFSSAMGISRVSFASVQKLKDIAGVSVGAATIFSILLDSAKDVTVVIDSDVLSEQYFGCTDGTTTSYMKIKTSDVIQKLLPYCHQEPIIINV